MRSFDVALEPVEANVMAGLIDNERANFEVAERELPPKLKAYKKTLDNLRQKIGHASGM